METPVNSAVQSCHIRSIAGLLLLAAVLRLVYFTGLSGFDHFAYAHLAVNLLNGTLDYLKADSFFAFRWMIILPTAVSFWLFGVSDVSAVAFPFVCSLGMVLAVWLMARELWGERTAFFAGLLQAFFPMSLGYSTTLFAEEILECFAGFAVLFFIRACLRGSKIYCLISGLCLGLAYGAHERAVILLGFLLLWSVLWRGSSCGIPGKAV